MSIREPIRLAVVGARRGRAGIAALNAFPEKISLEVVCDPDESRLDLWKDRYPDIRYYSDYNDVLNDERVDAVFIATPLQIHAEQSLAALRAGKHVLVEVTACHTLEQCHELVETVESTGLTYMMAENYCFMRSNMAVLNMAQQGMFGDPVHAEGAYIHDCKALTHDESGYLTWRGELNKDWKSVSYPTHSIGPVAQWLGIGKDGGDQFDKIMAVTSKPRSMHSYFKSLFGTDHPGADPGYWKQGDSQVAILTTKNGVTINLRVDWTSPRPHNMTHYGLQGTKGAYMSARHDRESSLVWIDGKSPGTSPPQGDHHAKWEDFLAYERDYDHPMWRKWDDYARKTGHGGGDFFVLNEFVDAIIEKRPPMIDVYDAVSWSSIIPLSAKSIAGGGIPVSFPDFKKRS